MSSRRDQQDALVGHFGSRNTAIVGENSEFFLKPRLPKNTVPILRIFLLTKGYSKNIYCDLCFEFLSDFFGPKIYAGGPLRKSTLKLTAVKHSGFVSVSLLLI